MGKETPTNVSLFIYTPNKVAPVIFAAAFFASAVGHIWQCYHHRSFKLVGLHPVCAVLFAAGYALREYSTFHPMYSVSNLIVYILSQVFIYICPPLLELANYHILGRLFYYVPHCAPLPGGRVLSIFGGLMAVVEALNSLGVSLAANPSSSHTQQQLGSRMTIAALAIQLCLIAIFILLAAIFHRRCARANIRARAISTPMIILYLSMSLILIRCIYRLVEHLGNTTVKLNDPDSFKALSPLLREEWFLYVFEATLMLLNSLLWNVWHPGRYLPRNSNIYLAQDGRTEVEAQVGTGGKPWLALLTHGILGREKQEAQPFLELRH